jgi:hypothetical protein
MILNPVIQNNLCKRDGEVPVGSQGSASLTKNPLNKTKRNPGLNLNYLCFAPRRAAIRLHVFASTELLQDQKFFDFLATAHISGDSLKNSDVGRGWSNARQGF